MDNKHARPLSNLLFRKAEAPVGQTKRIVPASVVQMKRVVRAPVTQTKRIVPAPVVQTKRVLPAPITQTKRVDPAPVVQVKRIATRKSDFLKAQSVPAVTSAKTVNGAFTQTDQGLQGRDVDTQTDMNIEKHDVAVGTNNILDSANYVLQQYDASTQTDTCKHGVAVETTNVDADSQIDFTGETAAGVDILNDVGVDQIVSVTEESLM